MIKDLVKIANRLDTLGLTKEADVIDRYISGHIKVAIEAAEGDLIYCPHRKQIIVAPKDPDSLEYLVLFKNEGNKYAYSFLNQPNTQSFKSRNGDYKTTGEEAVKFLVPAGYYVRNVAKDISDITKNTYYNVNTNGTISEIKLTSGKEPITNRYSSAQFLKNNLAYERLTIDQYSKIVEKSGAITEEAEKPKEEGSGATTPASTPSASAPTSQPTSSNDSTTRSNTATTKTDTTEWVNAEVEEIVDMMDAKMRQDGVAVSPLQRDNEVVISNNIREYVKAIITNAPINNSKIPFKEGLGLYVGRTDVKMDARKMEEYNDYLFQLALKPRTQLDKFIRTNRESESTGTVWDQYAARVGDKNRSVEKKWMQRCAKLGKDTSYNNFKVWISKRKSKYPQGMSIAQVLTELDADIKAGKPTV